MSIFTPVAQRSRAKLAVRGIVASSVVLSTGIAAVQPTLAAELLTAELVGTQNVVEVTQGRSADFTVTLGAGGGFECGATATAKVKNAFSISSGSSAAVSSGATLSNAVNFTSVKNANNDNCSITGGGTVPAQISAAAGTPVGTYSVPLSVAAGTTAVTNSNTSGGKLEDTTATTLTFRVVAPVVTNQAPVAHNAPAAATGTEGSTLQTSGSFTDADGDFASITASSGTLTADRTTDDKLSGSWSWQLPTTDNVSGKVTVTATDSHGATATQTFDYSSTNVAPRASVQAADANGNEGQTLTTSGSFADVSGDKLTITTTSTAGTLVDNGNGTYRWSLATTNETTGSVVVRATDDDGLFTEDTFNYSAANVAPGMRTDAQNVSGNEGSPLGNAGAFTDVPADNLTISKTGDGTLTPSTTTNGAWSWSIDGADNGGGLVSVTASDGTLTSSPDEFTYTVNNVAPAVAAPASNATGDEGTTLRSSGRFSDVATDPLAIRKVSGPGSVVGNTDGTWSWSYDGTDDFTGEVVVEANDGDLGVTRDTFNVTVRNVAPVVVGTGAADATGSEGNTLATHGAFSDVPADTITITATPGGTLVDNKNGTWSWSRDTSNQTAGTVTVTATDDDGSTVTDKFDYEAIDVAPQVTVAAKDADGVEGDTLTASGSFQDVAADPITITKGSGPGTVTDNGDGTWSYSLATADQLSETVEVIAAADGKQTKDSFAVAATNVAPVLSDLALTGNTGTACLTGNTVGLKFTVADPGSADTMTGTINWGDGSTESFTSRSVDTTHAYAPGSYNITVNVSDDDGAAADAKTAAVSRNYAIGAIQSPFNADGTSVFKYGSTVPVKVRITDCANVSVTTLAPTIRVGLASSTAPSTSINETVDSTSAADTTGVMRYDTTSSQYIYNMATKSLTDGDAKYVVKVADAGASVQQNFGLRTK